MSDIQTFYVVKYTSSDGSLTGFTVDPERQPPYLVKTFTDADEAEQFRCRCVYDLPGFTYEVVPYGLASAVNLTEWQRLAESNARIIEQRDSELAAMTSRMEAAGARASENLRNHQADIERIGETLLEKAQAHDWCAEFDRTVDDLNRHLHVELPERPHDYDVSVTVTVNLSLNARATDEDHAIQQVEFSREDIIEAVRNGSYDFDSDSYEASRS